MKTIYGYQWSEHSGGRVNFGDLLTEVVLQCLGYQYKPIGIADDQAPFFLGIGTILDADRVLRIAQHRKVYVWGSGYRANAEALRGNTSVIYKAVRGPLTRDMLWLTRDTPLGDPALVLPRFYESRGRGDLVCVPHWEHNSNLGGYGMRPISPMCDRKDVLATALDIAGASFVLAGSLHAAIIAHAFGAPWAFWGSHSDSDQTKWSDWMSFLGLGRLEPCRNLKEAKQWWESIGCQIPRTCSSLLDSFPHAAAV